MEAKRESTSGSVQFVPMRMADLMPMLLALKKPPDPPDLDEKDTNSSLNSENQPTAASQKCSAIEASIRSPSQAPTPRYASDENKENTPDAVDSVNYKMIPPGHNSSSLSLPHPFRLNGNSTATRAPLSGCGVESRQNVLTPQLLKAPTFNSAKKDTPISLQKKKPATPVFRVKKYTPTSAKIASSSRKTPQKNKGHNNKESNRCLFPELGPLGSEGMPGAYKNAEKAPSATLSRNQTPSHKDQHQPPATPSHSQAKIMLKTITIKGKKYMLIKKIGSGGSSDVYKVMEVGGCEGGEGGGGGGGGGGEYAVKVVRLGVERALDAGLLNEVRLLRELRGAERVVTLVEAQHEPQHHQLLLLLELGETDLAGVLRERAPRPLPPAIATHYWLEMLDAVHTIHRHHVIHADLKPANFLLVRGRLKLIDFGIASSLAGDATSVVRSCAAGTFSYISPEALMGGAGASPASPAAPSAAPSAASSDPAPIKISYHSDVWSLGCILYAMLYGRTPFSHIQHTYTKIAAILDPNHTIHFPPAPEYPLELVRALRGCLQYCAKSRPSVRQLLALRYLTPPAPPALPPLPGELLARLQPLVAPADMQLLRRACLPPD